MLGRQTIVFPLLLLALLAMLTLWIDRSVRPPGYKTDGNKRHDIDYMLTNFVSTRTGVDGEVRYILAATEMQHYPDDDSTQLVRPRFTQYNAEKTYTQVESQRGSVSSNGENVQFMDNVKVVREATRLRPEMMLRTEYLDVAPKSEIATTDKPVIITQAPKTIIHGTGMIYDKKQETIELLSNVKVHYERAGINRALPLAASQSINTDQHPKSQPLASKNNPRIRRMYAQPNPH